jgi:hypothetical protein
MECRAFLQTLAASAVGFALDKSRLLYVPEAKTLVLPEREIVQAKTLAEAVSRGLQAVWPDGRRLALQFWDEDTPAGHRQLEQAVNMEIAYIRDAGGRVVPNRQWKTYALADA